MREKFTVIAYSQMKLCLFTLQNWMHVQDSFYKSEHIFSSIATCKNIVHSYSVEYLTIENLKLTCILLAS